MENSPLAKLLNDHFQRAEQLEFERRRAESDRAIRRLAATIMISRQVRRQAQAAIERMQCEADCRVRIAQQAVSRSWEAIRQAEIVLASHSFGDTMSR